ncbi:MAG: T9SS type A sorting domain-containing protein [Chitinophagaceae bacterium]
MKATFLQYCTRDYLVKHFFYGPGRSTLIKLHWRRTLLHFNFTEQNTRFLMCALGIALLLTLLSAGTVSAQLVITPGAQFSVVGNMPLTLQNNDLINNGSFSEGNSITNFTGNASSLIGGSQPVQFYELEINKVNNSSVVLQRPVSIMHRILFTGGFLNLNGFNTDLGTAGYLEGERNNSRITGVNGGQVIFSTFLNAPAAQNPANLGAVFTSSQNLGNVIIKRGHQSQVNGTSTGSSILRYYDISPSNNTGLNATLRINYFEGELNGFDGNTLVFFKNDTGTNWSNEGFTTRNTNTGFVEKTGISSFARFTISGASGVLPVRFLLVNAKCEGGKVAVTWKTAQEQISHHFNIEKSADGIRWAVAGNTPAAGNSSNEKSYSFTDNNPAQGSFYRIAEYGQNGSVQFSGIFRSSCNIPMVINLWPNPVHEMVFVNIVTGSQSQAVIKLFDSKGALMKIQSAPVLPGSNQLGIDVKPMASGVYSLQIEWNNGQMKKTVQVIKQ